MKRKVLVTLLTLAAGFVAFLGYDTLTARMDESSMGFLHVPRFVSSALSSLGVQQVGIILLVVAIGVASIVYRGKEP